VVLHLGLDRLHASDVDPGVLAERACRSCRYLAALGEHLDDRELDLEPAAEAGLLGPEPAHLGPGVAVDHFRSSRPSVLPKPPLPRALAGSAATSSHTADVTGAITSCAIRSPRRTGTDAVPWFTSRTCTSPRKSESIVPGAFSTVTPSRIANPLRDPPAPRNPAGSAAAAPSGRDNTRPAR